MGFQVDYVQVLPKQLLPYWVPRLIMGGGGIIVYRCLIECFKARVLKQRNSR